MSPTLDKTYWAEFVADMRLFLAEIDRLVDAGAPEKVSAALAVVRNVREVADSHGFIGLSRAASLEEEFLAEVDAGERPLNADSEKLLGANQARINEYLTALLARPFDDEAFCEERTAAFNAPCGTFEPVAVGSTNDSADQEPPSRSAPSGENVNGFSFPPAEFPFHAEAPLRHADRCLRQLQVEPHRGDLLQDLSDRTSTFRQMAASVDERVLADLAGELERFVDRLSRKAAAADPDPLWLMCATVDVLERHVAGQKDDPAVASLLAEICDRFQRAEAAASPTTSVVDDPAIETMLPFAAAETAALSEPEVASILPFAGVENADALLYEVQEVSESDAAGLIAATIVVEEMRQVAEHPDEAGASAVEPATSDESPASAAADTSTVVEHLVSSNDVAQEETIEIEETVVEEASPTSFDETTPARLLATSFVVVEADAWSKTGGPVREQWLISHGAMIDYLRSAAAAIETGVDATRFAELAEMFDRYSVAVREAGWQGAGDWADRLGALSRRFAADSDVATASIVGLIGEGGAALVDFALGAYTADALEQRLDQLERRMPMASEAAFVAEPPKSEPALEETAAFVATESSTIHYEEANESEAGSHAPQADEARTSISDEPAETEESLHTSHEKVPQSTAADAGVWTNEIPEELREVFAEEAVSLLAQLDHCATELERAPNDNGLWNDARRAAHTFKGAAGAVGWLALSGLSGRLEALLDLVCEDGALDRGEARSLLAETTTALALVSSRRFVSADLLATLELRLTDLAAAAAVNDDDSAAKGVPSFENDERAAIDPELLEVFTDEAEDHLRTLHQGLTTLQRNPEDREALQEIRRAAHTLKGAAGAVGLRTITQLSHRMEDLLDQLFEGSRTASPQVLQLLSASTDALEDLATGQANPSLAGQIHDLYAQFVAVLGEPVDPEPPECRRTGSANSLEDVSLLAEELLPAAVRELLQQAAPAAEPTVELTKVQTNDAADKSSSLQATRAEDATGGRRNPIVRVPLERLDDLVRLVSELVINRTSFEQRMTGFTRMVDELQSNITKVRATNTALQSRYEARTLRSGGSGAILGQTGAEVVQSEQVGAAGESASSMSAPVSDDWLAAHDFDDLEFDRYTQFHLMTRALADAGNELNSVGNEIKNLIGDFDTLLNRQGRLSRDIQNRLVRIRMVPLSTLTARLQRTVRVVAQTVGKSVDLEIRGDHTELDKTVLEDLADPVLHLLRNSIDHGIETPEARRALGKPETATVYVRAFYQGTQVVIEVGDDGQGLDAEAIRATAVRVGLLNAADAEKTSLDELHQLIFAPGFSTAKVVSEVSGRGVGMDVVRTKVHRLKGTLAVHSTPGQGASFTIRLPMTLAIVRALLVVADGRTFAIPMQAVSQIVRVERKAIETSGQGTVLQHAGETYPLYRLGEVLQTSTKEEGESLVVHVLLVFTGTRNVAVQVDRILSGREIVVKTLGSHLRHVQGVMGATVAGDGTVMPILNVTELFEQGATPRVARDAPPVAAFGDGLRVMVIDDSVSVRRVVANLLKSRNWTPIHAKDGLEALELLQQMPQPPHVLLLDVEMPRMNGFELLTALRGQAAYRRTPIFMLTSRAGEKHRRKAMDLGATGFVVKPYQEEALLTLIRTAGEEAERSMAAAVAQQPS